MHLFPLENVYALRSYLRLSERKYFDDMTMIPLKNENIESFINITHSSIHYVIANKEMNYRYECYLSYMGNRIDRLYEFVYYFNAQSLLWHQTFDLDDNDFVKITRERIRMRSDHVRNVRVTIRDYSSFIGKSLQHISKDISLGDIHPTHCRF